MDDAERLMAIEEIKQLKARYFRCMDTKDWDGFADSTGRRRRAAAPAAAVGKAAAFAQFTPDAMMDVSGEMGGDGDDDTGITRGNRAIAEFVRSAIDDVVTVHHGHMPEIDVDSPTTATAVWAMEDMLRWPDGAPLREMHGYGHYHERYEKHDGKWRIASTRLTRLRVDVSTD